MIHARKNYSRFQDPALEHPELLGEGSSSPIAEDEPVILFRATDMHFRRMLELYRSILLAQPYTQPKMIEAIDRHIKRAGDWQFKHGIKAPDMPADAVNKEAPADAA